MVFCNTRNLMVLVNFVIVDEVYVVEKQKIKNVLLL